jgi:hypothetical protein
MPTLSRKFSLGQKLFEGCRVFTMSDPADLKYTICNSFTEPTVFGFPSRGFGAQNCTISQDQPRTLST